MKNSTLITICIVACILMSTKNFCNSLTFFIKEYPEIDQQKIAPDSNQLSKLTKATRPHKIARSLMPRIDTGPIVAGIFSTYAGYLAASDYNGQISFPENYFSIDRPKGYMLATRRVKPILTFGLNVFRLERDKQLPAALCVVELKKDAELEEYYWEVQQEKLTQDPKISIKTITIFAKPSKIYIPEGITPARAVANNMLPDIYIKKNSSKLNDALYVLTIKHFFAPAKKEIKREPLKTIVQY